MNDTPHANLIGCLTAAPVRTRPADEEQLTTLINARIRPPEPLVPGQVHIRSLNLISDAVNDHGGCFPAEEHPRLCELLVDSPVLIGHDRSRLPVARNFAARCLADGDRRWIQVWFYWMRGPEGDSLAADIDGGVAKEGSVGFEFRRPQCSVCGNDIRRCEHIPGREYAGADGGSVIAHYEYRGIVRVLETSLVYRRATPGTRLGREPVFCKQAAAVAGPDSATDPVGDEAQPLSGVVLSGVALPRGRHRYLIARRESDNPAACDEVVAVTTSKFRVGEPVRFDRGVWRRAGGNLKAGDCTPAPLRFDWLAFRTGRAVGG